MTKGKIFIVNYPSSEKDFRLIILKEALINLGFEIDFGRSGHFAPPGSDWFLKKK